MKTLVVNLFGGPGLGKSTTSAGLFYYLKQKGILCELITEYAKDRTWLNDSETLACQPYVSAKQLWRMERVNGKVDVMITDSPLLLGMVYAGKWESPNFSNIILEWFNGFENLNVLLKRDLEVHPYREVGRTQSLEEAVAIDDSIKSLLDSNKIEYEQLGSRIAIEHRILQILKQRQKDE